MISYLGGVDFDFTYARSKIRGLEVGPDLLVIFAEGQPKTVVNLKLQFYSDTYPVSIQNINWEAFDEQASHLPNLEIAEFSFRHLQPLGLVYSVAEIIPCLSRLRNANKFWATYQGSDDSEQIYDLDINNLERSLAALDGIMDEPIISQQVGGESDGSLLELEGIMNELVIRRNTGD